MTEQSDDGPSSTGPDPPPETPAGATRTLDPPDTDSEIGRQAVRIFRAARRRRLALPPDQRPRLSPGLVALLTARGWLIPDELRPRPREDTGPRPPAPDTEP